MRTTTSIITSDGKVIGGFEEVQKIAEKVQNAKTMKKITEKRNGSRAICGSQNTRIMANECAGQTRRIPKLLEHMNLCSWDGKIYSDSGMLRENFVGDLNSLLAWFRSIPRQTTNEPIRVDVTKLQMKSALKWLMLATKCNGFYGDLARVDNIVDKI
jgi:hypothetical protein